MGGQLLTLTCHPWHPPKNSRLVGARVQEHSQGAEDTVSVAVAGVRAAAEVRQQPQAELHHMRAQRAWERPTGGAEGALK